MNGLSRVEGVGPIVEIGPHKLRIFARTLHHYAEIEAQIIHIRGNPFDMIREFRAIFADQPELLRTCVETAFEQAKQWRFVTAVDFADYLQTREGFIHSVYLAVRENDPQKFTMKHVGELVTQHYATLQATQGPAAATEWHACTLRAIAQASCDDEFGSLDWWPTMTNKGDGEPVRTNWPYLFRKLAGEPYHLPPRLIGELTVNQLRILCEPEEEVSGKMQIQTAEGTQKLRQKMAAAKDQAVENLLQGRSFNDDGESETEN